MKLGMIASPQFLAAFERLLENKNIPIKTLFKLRGINKVVKEKSEEYKDLSTQIFQKYAKRNEEGLLELTDNRVLIPQDNIELFKQAQKELNEIEIPLENIHSEELGPDLVLPAKDFIILEFIVE